MQLKTKRVLVLTLFLVFMAAFAGCGGTSGGNASDSDSLGEHIHSFTRQVPDLEYIVSGAICTERAIYYYSCACGEKGTETFEYGSALGHSFICQVAEDKYLASNATCTDKASYYFSCSCGEKGIGAFYYGEALGHNFGDWEIEKQPTNTERGLKIRTCLRGGCTYYESENIPELTHSHSYTLEVAEDKYLAKNATCTQKAKYYYSCECGEKGTETFEYGSVLGHTEVIDEAVPATRDSTGLTEGKHCSVCGAVLIKQEVIPEISSVGLSFTVNEDGKTCSVTGIGTCTDTDVVIPRHSPYGYVVTKIGWQAFSGCSSLTSITIPDSVTSIGRFAFSGCRGLRSVVIGGGVTYIGDSAFWGCSGLTSITIPNKVTSIGDSAFYGCSGLTNITIPNSVTSIGWNAFEYCSGLTSIAIPDAVTYIGDSAFWGCSGLTSITIPDSVISIDSGAFYGCAKLERIYITDITAWCNISGLMNLMYVGSSNKQLYLYNEILTEVIIPESVTSIVNYAFWGCGGLASITIPESVTSIVNYAFWGCGGLASITIPESVTSIGNYAFLGCNGLETITVGADNTSYHSDGNCLIETESKTLILGCKNSTIPSDGSVTAIGDYAFYGCKGLTSIAIPDSVTSIGNGAFYDCSGFKTVYYKGTKEQWNNISISYSGNEELTDATMYYYSETEPALNADGTAYDGNFWHYDSDGKTPVIWKK